MRSSRHSHCSSCRYSAATTHYRLTRMHDSDGVEHFSLDWGFISFECPLFVRFLAESRLTWSLLSAQTDARMRTQKSAPISRIPPCPTQRGKSHCSGRPIESLAASDITVSGRREECHSAITRPHTGPSGALDSCRFPDRMMQVRAQRDRQRSPLKHFVTRRFSKTFVEPS